MKEAQPILDTRVSIVTPENIAFDYFLAGPFHRLPAYMADVAIRTLILIAFLFCLGIAGATLGSFEVAMGVVLTLWFVLSWFYGGLFETFWNGQTPGKRIFHLRVLSCDGQPINAQQAILRNILRAADGVLGMYQVGLLTAATTRRFQRLGDLACNTMVVVEEPQRLNSATSVSEPKALELARQLPPDLRLSPQLVAVLSLYMGRRRTLSWQRRQVIARHLAEPLRRRAGLPEGTSYDLLMCALYHREFFEDPFARNASPAMAISQPSSPPVAVLVSTPTDPLPPAEVAG